MRHDDTIYRGRKTPNTAGPANVAVQPPGDSWAPLNPRNDLRDHGSGYSWGKAPNVSRRDSGDDPTRLEFVEPVHAIRLERHMENVQRHSQSGGEFYLLRHPGFQLDRRINEYFSTALGGDEVDEELVAHPAKVVNVLVTESGKNRLDSHTLGAAPDLPSSAYVEATGDGRSPYLTLELQPPAFGREMLVRSPAIIAFLAAETVLPPPTTLVEVGRLFVGTGAALVADDLHGVMAYTAPCDYQAQLALALLADCTNDEFAQEVYQGFKRDVIAQLPDTWELTAGSIRAMVKWTGA